MLLEELLVHWTRSKKTSYGFSNKPLFIPMDRCKDKSKRERSLMRMDFLTVTGLLIEDANAIRDDAAFLGYDTLISAKIVIERKEKCDA